MKMAIAAILAVVTLNGFAAQAQVLTGVHCVGKTLPPGSCRDPEVCNSSNSFFYFTIDSVTSEPGVAGFRFHLYNGTGPVNAWEVPGPNVTTLNVTPFVAPGMGQGGEMKIEANLLNDFETVGLTIRYDGNDFSGRLPITARTKEQKEQALMNKYLELAQFGSFGHVSKDPSVPPDMLGGVSFGKAPWNNFEKTIDFKTIICARY